MSRKLFFIGVIFILLLTAAATPFSVRAESDPPPNPEPVKPPWITGINPNVSLSTEESEQLTPGGIANLAAGVEVPLLAPAPDFVDLEPQGNPDLLPTVASLAVPQFYQDPNDSTCGAAALGMALDFLSLNGEGEAPSQAALVADLKNSGLLYTTGTGVEELAFLARGHGYLGTTAFHDWTLDKLAEQLSVGKPVVVSLGSNGADQPGHFVTLTGISADGAWVSYNDPILGKQTIRYETFQKLWDLQGNSGLLVQKEPLSAMYDPMLPWMGLLSAMSTLAVLAKYYPQSMKVQSLLSILQSTLGNPSRKGLGGKLVPVYEWQEVQDGTKVIQDTSKKIYEYGTRMVQKGLKTVTDYSKKIFEYGTRTVQNGWKTVTNYSKKIYEYGTRMVQKGWKTVKNYGKKIYEYGTRWVTKGWKKVTSWVKGIWGWFKKSKWVPKKVKEKFVKGWHYATKKVPNMVKQTFVKGWHYATKKVPNMVKETFVKGWHYATKKVPNMVKENFVKGWHYATKVVPNYIMKKVQVGWEKVEEVVKETEFTTPTQTPYHATPTPTPYIQTPTPTPNSEQATLIATVLDPTPTFTATPSATPDWTPQPTYGPFISDPEATKIAEITTGVNVTRKVVLPILDTIKTFFQGGGGSYNLNPGNPAGIISSLINGYIVGAARAGVDSSELDKWKLGAKGSDFANVYIAASRAFNNAQLPTAGQSVANALGSASGQTGLTNKVGSALGSIVDDLGDELLRIGPNYISTSLSGSILQGLGAVGGLVGGGFQVKSGMLMGQNEDPYDDYLGTAQTVGGIATVTGSAITLGGTIASTAGVAIPGAAAAIIGAAPILLGVGAIAAVGVLTYNLLKDTKAVDNINNSIQIWANKPDGFVETAISTGQSMVESGIPSGLAVPVAVVDSAVQQTVKGVKNTINNTIENVKSAVETIGNAAQEYFEPVSNVMSDVSDSAASAIQTITQPLSNAADFVSNSVQNSAESFSNTLKNTADEITDFFGGLFRSGT